MTKNRKLILFIATSLDGYIAKPNDDLSFLSIVHKEGENYGYSEFIDSVDTVIMGRKTYDHVMSLVQEFPHVDITTYVMTTTPRANKGKTIFYNSSLKELVIKLKSENGKNIFCDGGAQIINQLLEDQLIDEMIISIIPIILGNGIRLFNDGLSEQKLSLISSKQFDTELIQIHYKLDNA
jgi:dihydrofolate reductase